MRYLIEPSRLHPTLSERCRPLTTDKTSLLVAGICSSLSRCSCESGGGGDSSNEHCSTSRWRPVHSRGWTNSLSRQCSRRSCLIDKVSKGGPDFDDCEMESMEKSYVTEEDESWRCTIACDVKSTRHSGLIGPNLFQQDYMYVVVDSI